MNVTVFDSILILHFVQVARSAYQVISRCASKLHQLVVFGVAFSPDGKILASASADKTVKLWNVETGKTPVLLATLNGHSNRVWGVAFSPDGKTKLSLRQVRIRQ